MVVSQHVLEKRALTAKFEEAIQHVISLQEENRLLKISQVRDAHERDAFCLKIEQLQKQLDQKESVLDLKKKKTKQLESGTVVSDVAYRKV